MGQQNWPSRPIRHHRSVDRLEQLVVHIEEALRLAQARDVTRLRLALLLLDSAAELILHRAVDRERQLESTERNLLNIYQEIVSAGRDLPAEDLARMRELEARLPTVSQARRLEKHFDEKAKFLRKRGLLDPAQVRVLRKLHEYRNEAQHNDKIRQCSLHSAVRIYAYLVCTMLRDLPTQGMMMALRVPDPLATYTQGFSGSLRGAQASSARAPYPPRGRRRRGAGARSGRASRRSP